ncbi:DUF2076 domain-containing protein [Thiohalocapsa sp. ML1]|uniref:DUF2076 domain-containing protein n=1 Tax=Thiohalocapsa sp. ML1 TaxID=1431688 RepID=UPI0007323DBE|nr:DUF2076 domain-containing protein [Thiohalocapsa sp. ML1]
MNPQERDMIEGLFQRLQQAETGAGPRDGEAEALIRERMAAQPAAAYLLAQVVLVQEQGLRNLQTRLEELEREVAARPQGGGGFLGGLFGAAEPPRPPAVAAASAPKSSGWSNTRVPPHATGMQPGAPGAPGTAATTGGGGFMAGAMQTAVGVAGGMLLANAVSGLFSGEAEAAAPEAAAPAEPAPEPEAIEPEPMEDDGGLFGDFFGGDEGLF